MAIKLKRGLEATIPTLQEGEPGFTTDSKKLFVGSDAGNIEIGALIEVTWQELKDKRDASLLTPGQQYRITDYECTTVQENTQSAEHPFDIIVTADDVNKLNENARACLHDGDTYFANSKLEAWQLKYCLDNDTDRFAWAQAEFEGCLFLTEPSGPNRELYAPIGTIFEVGTRLYLNKECTIFFNTVYSIDEDTGNPTYNKYGGTYVLSSTTILPYSEGKGVIYQMIDEFNNDVPYDFKNIQFKRDLFYDSDYDITFTDIYFYTFSAYSFDLAMGVQSDIEDATIIPKQEAFDEFFNKFFNNCHSNVIKPLFSTQHSGTIDVPTWKLNNNLLINRYASDDIYFDCYNNTFGHSCSDNIFGNSCYSNTFGNSCNSNTFGNGCYSNTFGDDCGSNNFANNCYSNTFGNSYYSNTFGDGCYSNTFGDSCNGNSFGDGCGHNTIGNNCYSNTFSIICHSNTFGNSCYYNTFGSGCNSNTFGSGCGTNTFGDDCNSNTFGDNCRLNTVGDYCGNNTFGNNGGTNTFGINCNSNTFGNSCSNNTFGEECEANAFGNSCYNNTFGDYCYYQTFGNACYHNTFGGDLSSNTFGNDCRFLQISDASLEPKRYIHVENGTRGASTTNKFDLYDSATSEKDYQVTFKKSASGKYLMLWATDTGTMTGKVKATDTTPTWEDIV